MTGLIHAPFQLPACILALALASVPCSSLCAQNQFALKTPATLVASGAPNAEGPSPSTEPAYSSSIAADSSPDLLPLHAGLPPAAITSAQRPNRAVGPFSTVALSVKIGVAGIGFDVTTPLAQRFNLRAGSSFFSYHPTGNYDGTDINGTLKFRSVNTSLDWYPFNNRFRISPGVTLYNGNGVTATAMVPGGQSFDLDDITFTSSTSDPIHGSASMTFGNRVAPSLTIGTGNVISRHHEGHFSFPMEIGFQYIGTPHINLALAGTACTMGYCQPTSDNADFQAELRAENNNLNNDISLLRFYPIASVGFAYKF